MPTRQSDPNPRVPVDRHLGDDGAEPSSAERQLTLLHVYDLLLDAYGPQRWWPAESRLEMIVGAFLTQNTAWTNVEKAMARLKAAGALSVEALRARPVDDLAELIRPSGYFRQKAKHLKMFVAHLDAHHQGSLDALLAQETGALRRELLGLTGVGPETADSIVLYAAGRPTFVVDAYTRRLFDRLGLLDRPTYEEVQAYCHARLPTDAARWNEFHALIVRLGAERCGARARCLGCPLRPICATGRNVENAVPARCRGRTGTSP